MIKLRKIILFSLMFLFTFITLIYYFMSVLTATESGVRGSEEQTFEDRILRELKSLPHAYFSKSTHHDNITEVFLKNLKTWGTKNVSNIWKVANADISKHNLFLIDSNNLGNIINALKNRKVVKADLDGRGTQLKFLLTLEGEQNVVFKPKWYPIDKIIEGPVYAGKDRYASEILAFYLSAILNKPLAPVSVERNFNMQKEILPVATSEFLKTTYQRRNSTCVYGVCHYCKKEDPICDVNGYLTGAVIFNVNVALKTYRSPWQRTYKVSKKAAWEVRNDYCRTLVGKLSKQRLYDLIDTAIFDFLIQNGDRHHYETFQEKIVWIDNGKGLGNPHIHHIDILAPLYQCCILRSDTWNRLQSLSGGQITDNLKKIKDVTNVITEEHLRAIEERLLIIFATVEFCRNRNKITMN